MPIFLQYILTFVGLIFAFGYGYGQWKQGTNQEKIDTISLLKSDVETLKEKVIELTSQVKNLTLELEQKDEKLKEWLEVFQGRNMDMVAFIKDGNSYMKDGQEFMVYTRLLLVRLDKYLNHESF